MTTTGRQTGRGAVSGISYHVRTTGAAVLTPAAVEERHPQSNPLGLLYVWGLGGGPRLHSARQVLAARPSLRASNARIRDCVYLDS